VSSKYGFRPPKADVGGADVTLPKPHTDLGADVEHYGDGSEPDELVIPDYQFGSVTDGWDNEGGAVYDD